jgi:hypothetical protein
VSSIFTGTPLSDSVNLVRGVTDKVTTPLSKLPGPLGRLVRNFQRVMNRIFIVAELLALVIEMPWIMQQLKELEREIEKLIIQIENELTRLIENLVTETEELIEEAIAEFTAIIPDINGEDELADAQAQVLHALIDYPI